MSVANYRYYSDSGAIYQVTLPTDFASALNYTLAVGTEPYVPASLSMRYATYQNIQLGAWVAVPVMQKFGIGVPPQEVFADGTNYTLQSSYGERNGAYPSTGIITIAGPQGAPGAAGSIGPAGPTGPQGPPGLGPHSYRTPAISFGAGTVVSYAHGLGRYPYFVRTFISCISANNGYSIGDECDLSPGADTYYASGFGSIGQQVIVNGTDVYVAMASEGPGFILNKSTAASVEWPSADWSLFVDLW